MIDYLIDLGALLIRVLFWVLFWPLALFKPRHVPIRAEHGCFAVVLIMGIIGIGTVAYAILWVW